MVKMVEKLIRKRPVYRGKSINFNVDTILLPNGKKATREYLDHPGAVGVLPFLNPHTIIMVRQYRHPVEEITYEIPAGKLHSNSESPKVCLSRELREETGYTARRIRPLLSYWPSPAFSNEILHLFYAEDLTPGSSAPDEDEFLCAFSVPYKTALQWVFQGKIQDSKTVIALLAYEALHNRKHYTTFGSALFSRRQRHIKNSPWPRPRHAGRQFTKEVMP
ncbi:MAG: NUDIX hydrolase [Elusimicrobia bacterium]|nr:NUDIX hydrolase [Elusimicrobiota bacterium]